MMRRYSQLTHEFAKWLLPKVDRLDWGYTTRHGEVVRAATNDQLQRCAERKMFPQALTRTLIQAHLDGAECIHYTPRRGAAVAFAMIDVDAHRGQDDALDAALFIVHRYFPLAYFEWSARGYHIHLLVRREATRPHEMNARLQRLEEDLGVVLRCYGFRSTVEVKGRLTTLVRNQIAYRGALARIPRLWGGYPALKRLVEAPEFDLHTLDAVHTDAGLIAQLDGDDPSVHPDSGQARGSSNNFPEVYVWSPGNDRERQVRPRQSACAFQRMMWACFDFTTIYHRLPDVDELLEYYQRTYETDEATPERRRRAEDAIVCRARTFDPAKAAAGGYEHYRLQLLDAVQAHCLDRSHKCATNITDEDLAIGLYTVMRNSFSVREDPRLQWTCPQECFSGMFKALKTAGLTKRSGACRNKVVAIKTMLQRAGLIDCVDDAWRQARGKCLGIGKKYTIGRNHWRYAEFVRFSQGIDVIYLRRSTPHQTPIPASASVTSTPAAVAPTQVSTRAATPRLEELSGRAQFGRQ